MFLQQASYTPSFGGLGVSWSAPADGGSSITQYSMTSTPGGIGKVVDGSTLSTTLTGLTNGVAYTFTVTATNAVGTSTPSSPSNEVTPVGLPGPPTDVQAVAGDEFAVVTWTAPASDGGTAITQYTVTSNPGGVTAIVDGSQLTATLTGLTNGVTYTFTGTATNAVGTSAPSTATNAVIPKNDPPVAVMSGDLAATEGELLDLGLATFTDTEAADTHTATVDWGDGTVVASVVIEPNGGTGALTGTHVYGDNGTYAVMVTVADQKGGVDGGTFTITVANVSPVVAAAPNQTTNEGTTLTIELTLGFSDPGFGSGTTTESFVGTVDWDDGTTSTMALADTPGSPGTPTTGTVTGSHTYPAFDDASYSVTVTITDDDGGVGISTFSVVVQNAVPTVSAGSDQTASADQSNIFPKATFTDPGAADTHTASIDWGDGTVVPASIVGSRVLGSHTYNGAGTFIVTLTVTDNDGGAGLDTFNVTVTSAPAIVNLPSASVWAIIVLAVLLGGQMARRLGRGGAMGGGSEQGV